MSNEGRTPSPGDVITLPADDRLVWPGGYLGCLSARFTRSWTRGDGYERCYLPRGHEGDHDNLSDRGRMTWPVDATRQGVVVTCTLTACRVCTGCAHHRHDGCRRTVTCPDDHQTRPCRCCGVKEQQ